MRGLLEGIAVILGIALVGGLLIGLLFLIFGGKEAPIGELFFRIAVIVGINVLMLTIGFLLYYLAGGGWKRRNQADMEVLDRVLQCSVGNYFMPVIGFMLFFMFLAMAGSHYEEYIAALQKEGIHSYDLIPWGFALLSVAVLYYLVRRKVFYSARTLKLVPLFGKGRIFSWREIRKVTVRMQKGERMRLKLITDGRSYVLKSNVYSDGWEEFARTLLAAVKEYNIPIRWDNEKETEIKKGNY
ncbi:MAG: hypothetical protein J1E35_08860 [Lachnospiraceae bacterium]|nr:hypothetical protein [Lachnospiraceae bacterium]